MGRRARIHAFLSALSVLACVSCIRPNTDDPQRAFSLNLITVSGCVFCAEDGRPVDGAELTLCAYGMEDLERKNPVSTAHSVSFHAGKYRFSITYPAQTIIWSLSVEASGYENAYMDLYLDTDTKSYDEYAKSFTIESLDFYLDKN